MAERWRFFAALRRGALGAVLAVLVALPVTAVAAPPSPSPAGTREAQSASANPALEARMMALASQLRCLVCQNETIADSQADLASDLRQEIREMMARGETDAQIRKYMTDRYGDFVLFKPPFKATTAMLWLGPPALLVAALTALWLTLRQRQRASPDAFEPDTPDDETELDPAG